jgi:hypothetical protein
VTDGQLNLDGVSDSESTAENPLPASTYMNGADESFDSPQPSAPVTGDTGGPAASAESETETASSRPSDPEAVAVTQGAAPCEAEGERLFFLTNRMNLNGVLSSRILAPRESFQKYYSDLLELCPGWVPLLTAPPTADLIDQVMSERGAGAPVLIELSESALEGKQADAPVIYVRGALLSSAKGIHFRDNRSLREHRARGYDNVHPHDELLQVSPELFESNGRDDVQIAAPEVDPATDWLHLDRVRGAVSAVLAAADSGEALALAASVLGAQQLPENITIPPWLTWNALTGDESATAPEAPAEFADRLIFQAAYRVLGRQDQSQAWSPSAVLETVASEIAAANADDETRAIIHRNLQRIQELVDVDREFEPFRNPGSPYVAAKAFLMTLLRPDLGQLLEWSIEETGADVTTRSVAAVLAGCLRGVARESVALRSVALDDLSAAWAVHRANGDTVPLGAADFSSNTSETALLLNGQHLSLSAPLVPDPVSLYNALNDDARRTARLAVSRRLNWPVDVHIRLPAESEVIQGDSLITITTIDAVTMETSVNEIAFLERLRGLTGRARQIANDALT